VNEYLEQAKELIRAKLAERSDRERWIMVGVAALLATLFVRSTLVRPLELAALEAQENAERLEGELQRAARLAPQLQRLEGEIQSVEQRIQTGQETNLLGLLQQLAAQAQMSDRLERIDPKTPSRNERYPESRVEVQLRSVTLDQTVQFLYSIESAPLYLIVRSVRIRARADNPALLDVNFSVSSFQRA